MSGTQPLSRRDLGDLHLIGSGGEGQVFRCSKRPGEVFKEFRAAVRHELNPAGLAHTINVPATLPLIDRSFLAQRTAWPTAPVVEGTDLLGFVMPEVDSSFIVRYGAAAGPRDVLCDWNLMMFRERTAARSAIVSDVPPVSDDDLIGLLLDLALLFDCCHRNNLILGDVSGTNILWRLRPEPQVFLIDCDGIHPYGVEGVTKDKQSPGWVDPHLHGGATFETDHYKLSLAIFRAYFAQPSQVPESAAESQSEIGQRIHALARRVAPGDRPTARDWIALLFDARRAVRADRGHGRGTMPTRPAS